jgi:pyruvate kinase
MFLGMILVGDRVGHIFFRLPIRTRNMIRQTNDTELSSTAGTQTQVGSEYPRLAQDVSTEDILLLDDGRIALKVETVTGSRIETEVLVGGKLSDNKGIDFRFERVDEVIAMAAPTS